MANVNVIKEGTLKYVGGSVYFCDGSTWTAFGTAAGGEYCLVHQQWHE